MTGSPVRLHVERPLLHETGAGRSDLHDDRLQEALQRLALFCAVGAGTWSVGLVMEHVMRPLSVPTMFPWPGNLIAGVVIVMICAVLALLPWVTLRHVAQRIAGANELGSYELVEKLGEGGMGEVWRAEHRLLVRPAAIKLVRPEMLGAASERDARAMLGQFEREAQATAVLNSPHTIDVFDFGLTRDGAFYYVMELLIGRDLESLVRDFGALPASRVTYLLRQVCHSLAEAHARGLVHRDVKPANVYVCHMGLDFDFVKVLDFGLVRFSTRRTGTSTTLIPSNSVTTGTPAYMAPEAILGESRVDARADVYSIGCLAYWLLTGQLVFKAASPMNMLIAHVEQTPQPPSHRTELPIPSELEQIVLACLDKNPDRRPQSAQVLWQRLLDCRSSESWTPEISRRWWEGHLPELISPQVLAMPTVRRLSSARL
jgi:serine/threonine protein kinase